jgi:hypothetical protein
MRDAMFSGAIRTAVVIAALAAVMPAAAHADTGPRSAQLLAVAQTELVFLNLTQPDQVASPASCDRGQPAFGVLGLFMLPQYVSGTGDTTFDCRLKTRNVLLDLGSAAATEDATANTYTLADGTELPFRPRTLERICDDVLATGFTAPAPATLDGKPITGAVAVSTPAFPVLVHRGAPPPLWQDSIDVGHPGRLAASYCGWKAQLKLSPGRHTIVVDLGDVAPGPARFIYNNKV